MTGLYIFFKYLTAPGALVRGMWEQTVCRCSKVVVEDNRYLRRDELGLIAQGEHWISFLPYGSNASDSCGVNSTITMTVIEKTVT